MLHNYFIFTLFTDMAPHIHLPSSKTRWCRHHGGPSNLQARHCSGPMRRSLHSNQFVRHPRHGRLRRFHRRLPHPDSLQPPAVRAPPHAAKGGTAAFIAAYAPLSM